jgi:excisionase family DNA binding protein
MEENISFDSLPAAINSLGKKLDRIERLLLEQSEQQPIASEKLLSIKEAADFLNLSVPTIYSKVSKNEMPHMKRGKRLYFTREELLDYIKGGRKKTNSEIESEALQSLVRKQRRM